MALLASIGRLSAKSILLFEVRFKVWPPFLSRSSQFHSLGLVVVSLAFRGRNIVAVLRSVCKRVADGSLGLRRETSVLSKGVLA